MKSRIERRRFVHVLNNLSSTKHRFLFYRSLLSLARSLTSSDICSLTLSLNLSLYIYIYTLSLCSLLSFVRLFRCCYMNNIRSLDVVCLFTYRPKRRRLGALYLPKALTKHHRRWRCATSYRPNRLFQPRRLNRRRR